MASCAASAKVWGGCQLGPSPVISIVDDDAWARSGLADLILSLGYEVRAFESAEQFIQSDSITDTACLITDLNMPGLSGLDLQKRIVDHAKERIDNGARGLTGSAAYVESVVGVTTGTSTDPAAGIAVVRRPQRPDGRR